MKGMIYNHVYTKSPTVDGLIIAYLKTNSHLSSPYDMLNVTSRLTILRRRSTCREGCWWRGAALPTEPWKCSGIRSAKDVRGQSVRCVSECVCVRSWSRGIVWKSSWAPVRVPGCHPHSEWPGASFALHGSRGDAPKKLDLQTPEIEESEYEITDLK